MSAIQTVDRTIPVAVDVARALDDSTMRALAGRLVSRLLQPASIERLFETMDAVSAEAARRGLTAKVLDEELAAYNAERREPSAPPSK